MAEFAHTLVVFYDSYHTPLSELAQHLSGRVTVLLPVLSVPPPSIGSIPNDSWKILELDLRSRFCDEILQKAIKANARYQGGYYLSAALSRPLIATACVEALHGEGETTCIVHGFAGNDQVRFEAALLTLDSDLRVRCVAELLGSRTFANGENYTISENLWGRSTEAGVLADPWQPILSDRQPRQSDTSQYSAIELLISFECGVPVALNGATLELAEIIERLDAQAILGPLDMVEDGWVGLKSRALYKEPAAEILVAAHADLERFVSSRNQNLFKAQVDEAWSRLIYEGGWFDPQRASLEAYIDEVNAHVSGDVRVLVGIHGVRVTGRRSKLALYDERAAIYRVGQDTGLEFVRGLRDQVAGMSRIARSRRKGA